MRSERKLIALYTILHKEVVRATRLWLQTLLPPAVTTVLYYLIFGRIIGHRIGYMHGYPYIQFIAPGLIMMQVIMAAYSSSVSSLFSGKFQRSIEEMLVSPAGDGIILIGHMVGGVLRGLVVGLIVSMVTLLFTKIHVHSIFYIVLSAFLAACIFSLGGVINAIVAKTFDDISIIPNFVLTPLTYLGGVFYSVTLLPDIWQKVSYFNPIVYMVSSFRYGFLALPVPHLIVSYLLMGLLLIVLFICAMLLFKKSAGLRQ